MEKPDIRMAALSMLEVRDRRREGITLTTALLLSGRLEDINTRCCLAVCELMSRQAEVVLRGTLTRPVSEDETLSHTSFLHRVSLFVSNPVKSLRKHKPCLQLTVGIFVSGVFITQLLSVLSHNPRSFYTTTRCFD